MRAATPCTALSADDLRFDAPVIDGYVRGGSGCWALPSQPGETIAFASRYYTDAALAVRDGDGRTVCELEGTGLSSRTCLLTGSAPYDVQVTTDSANDYYVKFQVADVSAPTGCATFTPAPFGAAASEPASVTPVEGGVLGCSVARLEPGSYLVQAGPLSHTAWSIHAGDGGVVCDGSSSRCVVATAGDYTLVLRELCCGSRPLDAAVVPLAVSTPGCAVGTETSWSAPVDSVHPDDSLQVDCVGVRAGAGDRILPATSDPEVDRLVVDETGADVCMPSAGDRVGCVLTGAPPYRLITSRGSNASYGLDYRRAVRSISDPQGCPTVAPAVFGTVPGDSAPGIGCRLLVPPTSGTYYVRTGGSWGRSEVYQADGTRVCGPGASLCSLAAGQAYLLVESPLDATFVTAFHALSGGGCPTGAIGPEHTWAGSLAAGQVDCRELPAPVGATLTAIRSGDSSLRNTDVEYVDATGAVVCTQSGGLVFKPCTLAGVAPFRMLTHGSSPSDYALAAVRLDEPGGCAPLAKGAVGAVEGGHVDLPDGQHVACLSFPASEFTGQEIMAYQRTAGASSARLLVTDEFQGVPPCLTERGARGSVLCRPVPVSGPVPPGAGRTLSALVITDGTASSWDLVRQPVDDSADCQPIASTTASGKPATGNLEGYLDMDCYRITAEPTDRVVVNLHGTSSEAVLEGYRPDGSLACQDYGRDLCRLRGSSSYQLVVRGAGYADGGGDYQLESTLLMTAAGPTAACQPYTGPVTGTLSADRPGFCLTVDDDGLAYYTVNIDSPDGGTALPIPHVVKMGGSYSDCAGQVAGGYLCRGFATTDGQFVVAPGVLYVQRPDGPDSVQFSMTMTCDGVCNPPRLRSLSPPSLLGTRTVDRTLTVSKGGWNVAPANVEYAWLVDGVVVPQQSDSNFRLTPDLLGHTVAARVTASRDLYGTVVVDSAPATIGRGTAPVVVTRPTVTGRHRVGSRLAATTGTWSKQPTDYRYRWYAGKRVVGTGPRLLLEPSMAGKRLHVEVTATRTGCSAGSATSEDFAVRR